MTNVKVTEELVDKIGHELAREIEQQFPSVEARFATRRKLSQERSLEVQGFPTPSAEFHGYILLLAPPTNHEDPEAFAINRATEIWEEKGIIMRVKVTNRVRCKKSEPLVAYSVGPGTKAYGSYVKEDKRGIVFSCFFDQPHEHDWGRLKPQG